MSKVDEGLSLYSQLGSIRWKKRELAQQYAHEANMERVVLAKLARLVGEAPPDDDLPPPPPEEMEIARHAEALRPRSETEKIASGVVSAETVHRTIVERVTNFLKRNASRMYDPVDVRLALLEDGGGAVEIATVRSTLMRLKKADLVVRPRHGKYQWADSIERRQTPVPEEDAADDVEPDDAGKPAEESAAEHANHNGAAASSADEEEPLM